MTRSFLDELAWRGLLQQQTDGAREALSNGSVSAYCGFDATASSLHIGHLVPITGLVHLQRTGHRPIALLGVGTGMIGDPSGRSSERNLQSLEQVEANAVAIRAQLEHFIDFSGPFAARMENNADWLMKLKMVDFLRDVGKHFSINVMLAKDSVKSRLDVGISYTEFSYMLLQAYDFLELNRRVGCTLQIGGSDQWGNITAGTELIRRTLGAEAHGVTLSLVTGSDGKKFGKTADGTSVWLDPARTSPYRFYQYFVNADDRDVVGYLRMFTLLEREAVEALEQAVATRPEGREAQGALAMDVTTRVHGTEAAAAAREASRIVFDKKADPRSLGVDVLEMLRGEIPYTKVPVDCGLGIDGMYVIQALVDSELVKSNSEARRQLQQGAVSVNGIKLESDQQIVSWDKALHGMFFLIRKGGRDVALVERE